MRKSITKKRYRITIIDNDKNAVEKMIRILHKEGYQVDHIGQKNRLLTMIKNKMIDVLIIDVDAGVTKRYNIISQIKKMDHRLPIIVTSCDDSIEVAARVREQGIFFFTIKPLDLEEIKLAIKNVLDRKYTFHSKSVFEQVDDKLNLGTDSMEKNDIYGIQKHLNWIMAFFVHECKGTLGAVMMNISALVDRNIACRIKPYKQSKMLLSSLCSLKMLHDMIRNYVISYIGENKRLPCAKKRTDLYNDCLKPVIKDFKAMLEKNEMDITVSTKGDCIVYGDAELIRIGISNLINNAIKYGSTGTDINCDLLACSNTCRLSIVNEGIGVEKERLGDIFEKFARFDRVGISGTGLGLHVVKMIADVHDGSIKVESGYLVANNCLSYNEYNADPYLEKNNKEDLRRYAKFTFEIPSTAYLENAEVKNERTESSSYCR